MNIIIITGIIIVVVLLLIYFYYYYYYIPGTLNSSLYQIQLIDNNELTFNENYTNILQMNTLVFRDTLYVPKLGYGLTFVWDMYISSIGGNDKWQHSFNILKPIIAMNDSPVISYHPKKNYLSIVVKYRNNPFYVQFSDIQYKEIKLQRWSRYIVIIDNRTLKLYIDNVLVLIKVLPSVIVIYDINSSISLGQQNNNFLGKIKNLSLYPYPLSQDEIDNVKL